MASAYFIEGMKVEREKAAIEKLQWKVRKCNLPYILPKTNT
jgi:hypothetical protein